MEVKWAVANGAWSAGATWNDGVVPTTDDVVYLDGHTITIPASFSVKEIRNDVNPNTNLEGGSINCNVNNVTITADLYAHTSTLVLCSTANITIVGNIYGCDVYSAVNSNCVFYYNAVSNINITINGNIDNREGYCIFGSPSARYMLWVINGNVKVKHFINGGTYNGNYTYIINGNLEAYGNNDWWTGSSYGITTINITGNLIGDMYFTVGTLTIGAGYYYTNKYNLNMRNTTFVSDSPTIRYIGPEPNPNNYIVLGKNDLAQTYPPENKVLAPTIYGAQMELVGTFEPNYPPESVVLDGFEYAFGEMTGTMDVEVTSQNTINVYPYKRRT